jgi:integrase
MRKGELLPENEKLLRKFEESMISVEEGTKATHISRLTVYAKRIGKPMDQVTREELLAFLNKYRNTKIKRDGEWRKPKPRSVKSLIIAIKLFYWWFHGEKEEDGKKIYPEIVRGLKPPRVDDREQKIYPSAEEFVRILNATYSVMYKALFAVGYETTTAGRPKKELLNMRIGDVRIENNVAYITLRVSKTRTRTVIVKKFINEFRAWLNQHPFINDPMAWLWICQKKEYFGQKLGYQSANTALKNSCKRAGTRPYSLRALRHRRAKDLDFLSPRKKMAYFGWRNIRTAEIYGNFSSEDACEDIISHEEGKPIIKKEEVETWKCPACQGVNPPTNKFCGNCSQPKDDIVAIQKATIQKATGAEVDEIVDKVLEKLRVLIKDKEVGSKALKLLVSERA